MFWVVFWCSIVQGNNFICLNLAAAQSMHMSVHVSQEHMGCCLDKVSEAIRLLCVTWFFLKKLLQLVCRAMCLAKVGLGKVSNKWDKKYAMLTYPALSLFCYLNSLHVLLMSGWFYLQMKAERERRANERKTRPSKGGSVDDPEPGQKGEFDDLISALKTGKSFCCHVAVSRWTAVILCT